MSYPDSGRQAGGPRWRVEQEQKHLFVFCFCFYFRTLVFLISILRELTRETGPEIFPAGIFYRRIWQSLVKKSDRVRSIGLAYFPDPWPILHCEKQVERVGRRVSAVFPCFVLKPVWEQRRLKRTQLKNFTSPKMFRRHNLTHPPSPFFVLTHLIFATI